MAGAGGTERKPGGLTFLVREIGWFWAKQVYACLFGISLLSLILLTHFYWPDDSLLARYDFLFLMALFIQALMLTFRLETFDEAKVIFIFHIVGTLMELYKTSGGSWYYPEDNFFRIAGVPLFSGFMYASVGSYFARVWRLFDFRFTTYPPMPATVLLAMAIYVNFFTHEILWDFRPLLFVGVLLLYGRTWLHFTPLTVRLRMPIVVALMLGAGIVWLAENFSTYGKIWLYPHQEAGWMPVPLSKYWAWFLLMIISGVLVTFARRPEPEPIKKE